MIRSGVIIYRYQINKFVFVNKHLCFSLRSHARIGPQLPAAQRALRRRFAIAAPQFLIQMLWFVGSSLRGSRRRVAMRPAKINAHTKLTLKRTDAHNKMHNAIRLQLIGIKFRAPSNISITSPGAGDFGWHWCFWLQLVGCFAKAPLVLPRLWPRR